MLRVRLTHCGQPRASTYPWFTTWQYDCELQITLDADEWAAFGARLRKRSLQVSRLGEEMIEIMNDGRGYS